MNFPFYIARRYLFAKKSHNVINVISAISVAGIMLASFALICTLSVFNGFHELVESLFKDFDPELKIVSTDKKFFSTDDERIKKVLYQDFIDVYSFTLEEQALISYKSKQQIAMIKGVDDSYHDLVGIERLLKGNGIYMLEDDVCRYAIMGVGLMGRMDCGMKPAYPLRLYVPKKEGNVSIIDPTTSFNQASIYSPGVVFCVEQEKYDDNYVLISLELAQQLTGRENEASALEVRTADGISLRKAIRQLESLLGPDFKVQDRLHQQQDVFKVFKMEKFISYLFLTFILLIACFNIIGSLIMLMVEKQQDAGLLESMGAEPKTVEKIFIINGVMISLIGAVTGLLLGIIAVLLQQQYGFISLGSAGNFIVDAYPVSIKIQDIILVLVTVLVVSFLSVRPIGPIARKFIRKSESD
ncbi:MAG: ABC transporter permease [Bacteroidaceae bacterium]|nr:ABC transporter permease [Bacteroidaceae bacterium]MBR5707502.1 ABC transporter permease [Bacteroidaceae bacterium]